MRGPARSSGPRSNAYSRSKYTNWTPFNPFDSEVPNWRFDDDPERVVGVEGTAGVPLFVRALHSSFLRPYTPSDVAEVLASVPPRFLVGIKGVHLLGGSLKQTRTASSQLFHYGCYGFGRICLHAFPRRLLTRRLRSLPKPHLMQEYVRAGATYTKEKAHYEMRFSQASLRRFYLYDVLLHEIGHHVDRSSGRRDRRTSESYARWFAAEQANRLSAREILRGCVNEER